MTITYNNDLNGIEIASSEKMTTEFIKKLKLAGFRWSCSKKIWYAKQNEKTLEFIKNIDSAITRGKEEKTKSLYDRCIFVGGNVDTSKYDYKFVGSNYDPLLTIKDIAKIVRQHLKRQFPECKFSVRCTGYRSITCSLKSSPYKYEKMPGDLMYSQKIEWKKIHNVEINAILKYCTDLLNSYNFDDSDIQTDYFNAKFYDSVCIDYYEYIQAEETEQSKKEIEIFKQKEKEKQEQEQKRIKEEMEKRQQEEKAYQQREEQRKKEIEIINNDVKIIDLKKPMFFKSVAMPSLNKNMTLKEYKEERLRDFGYNDIYVTRNIVINSFKAFKHFCNNLLTSFEFLKGFGGYNPETGTLQNCIAVYHNDIVQFIIDPEGFSYARYVGFVDDIIRLEGGNNE